MPAPSPFGHDIPQCSLHLPAPRPQLSQLHLLLLCAVQPCSTLLNQHPCPDLLLLCARHLWHHHSRLAGPGWCHLCTGWLPTPGLATSHLLQLLQHSSHHLLHPAILLQLLLLQLLHLLPDGQVLLHEPPVLLLLLQSQPREQLLHLPAQLLHQLVVCQLLHLPDRLLSTPVHCLPLLVSNGHTLHLWSHHPCLCPVLHLPLHSPVAWAEQPLPSWASCLHPPALPPSCPELCSSLDPWLQC